MCRGHGIWSRPQCYLLNGFTLTINLPWWPWSWNWCALFLTEWATILYTNCGVSGNFRSQLITRTTWHHDHDLWPWRSWRLSVTRARWLGYVYSIPCTSQFEVRRTSRSEDMTHFQSQHLVDLVTFKLGVHYWATILQILMFWWLFILDLWANTLYASSDLDLLGHCTFRWYVLVLHQCTKFDVRMPL